MSTKYIFLDTCIIQDIGSSNDKSKAVIGYLTELAQEGFRLVISEFTIYENIQGLWDKRASKAIQILKDYEAKEVTKSVLFMAAYLQGLYHDEKYDNIADGDKIIAPQLFWKMG